MNAFHRPFVYESDDFDRLRALVVADCAVRGDAFVWRESRLVDWKYNLCMLPRLFPGNYASAAELWFDGEGRLAGCVIFEDFNERFDCLLPPERAELYPEMLAWAVAAKGGRYPRLATSAMTADKARTTALSAAGFAPSDETEVSYRFDTADFLDQADPESPLAFLSLARSGDYEAQARLRLDAWPKSWASDIDRAVRAYARTSPVYDAGFDFVLADAEGRHLSGAEAFIDRANRAAEIERVCTRSDSRGRGYCALTLRLTLRALARAGVPRAYLSGGYPAVIRLYGSLGHAAAVERRSFVRPGGNAPKPNAS